MRFKIYLRMKKPKPFLPIDYQYSLASAVYKMVARGDQAYAQFLHDNGFGTGKLKRFKLFSFGALALPRYTVWREKGLIELHDNDLSFVVSFMADKAAEAFVTGMFHNQEFSIGDRFSQTDMEVTSVEAQSAPFFKSTMHYRCLSPLVIELKEPGKKYETYLPPDDPRFEELLFQNLVAKCASMDLLINNESSHPENFGFQLKSSYRSKLVAIKPYTKEETKVRGYIFDFSLTAPDYVHEMGYYAGFGVNNAMGFGAVEVK
jgi:CRISPR-associated endoribonuclease Cas6